VKFKKLLEPAYIGKVRLRNRIIKTASGTSLIEKDGTVGDRMKAFYETLARGGVGLLIFETCSVEHPRGSHRPPAAAHLDDDKLIPSYKELTDIVHQHGCPIFIQLMHAGAWFPPGQGVEAGDRVSASALTQEELPGTAFVPPRELSIAEIKDMIDIYVRAAERAKQAGFDGVEINGSHYHLINSFLSGFWNRRHDEYGCDSIENRARFMCEIIREVKKRCGSDYAVDTLINAAEYGLKNGITLEETKQIARLMQDAGADSIQLRAAGFGPFSGILHIDRFFYPELPKEVMVKELDWSRKGKAVVVPYATEVKKVVSVPVYVASRLDPVLAEELLQANKIDLVGMTRRLLADPELPNKVAGGRLEDIAPCAGCNFCWHERLQNKVVRCRINAALGRELETKLEPAQQKKRVLIAGGGPAGMEAARVAALRGHQVILCEKETRLGGSMPIAAMVKEHERENVLEQIQYLKRQINKLGVVVRLGTEVSPSLIDEVKPDAVILATGGLPAVPAIAGIEGRKVVSGYRIHRMLKTYMRFFSVGLLAWLTRIWMPVGKRVVIIGGAIHGCQLAEFLVRRGRRVTIVDEAAKLGDGLLTDDPDRLFKWLKKKGAVMMAGVRYEEVTDAGLVVTTGDGRRVTIEADTIITALPFQADKSIAATLGKNGLPIYQIGDSRNPGLMPDAIADGFDIARRL
jgi:2,4-dienoyl-CoA reductase (NADPH2)